MPVAACYGLAHWIGPFLKGTQSIIRKSSTAHSCDTDDCHGRLCRRLRVGPVATAGVLNRIMAYRPAPFFPLNASAHAPPLIDDTLSTEQTGERYLSNFSKSKYLHDDRFNQQILWNNRVSIVKLIFLCMQYLS